MKRHQIPTHDLYTMSVDRMTELMREANVHYHPEGSRVLAEDVAQVIRAALSE
jgi:lysophospholipase L1-like esterase